MDLRHRLANIFGNLGVSFFLPLMGNGVAQMAVNDKLNLETALITSAFTAGIMSAFSISYEMKRYGEKR